MIAFQGSESSTSDGVLKVFEKAQKYLERNEVCNIPILSFDLFLIVLQGVIPVVLLDEVGLAEISKYEKRWREWGWRNGEMERWTNGRS